ncbi:MAG: hypothetical protein ACXVYB_00180 [Arthrobacter sp.]
MKLEEKFTLTENPAAEEGQVWFSFEETKAYPHRRVWTIVEGESGALWAQTGYHIVNRVYYAVTEQEWTEQDEPVDYLWIAVDEEGNFADD